MHYLTVLIYLLPLGCKSPSPEPSPRALARSSSGPGAVVKAPKTTRLVPEYDLGPYFFDYEPMHSTALSVAASDEVCDAGRCLVATAAIDSDQKSAWCAPVAKGAWLKVVFREPHRVAGIAVVPFHAGESRPGRFSSVKELTLEFDRFSAKAELRRDKRFHDPLGAGSVANAALIALNSKLNASAHAPEDRVTLGVTFFIDDVFAGHENPGSVCISDIHIWAVPTNEAS